MYSPFLSQVCSGIDEGTIWRLAIDMAAVITKQQSPTQEVVEQGGNRLMRP